MLMFKQTIAIWLLFLSGFFVLGGCRSNNESYRTSNGDRLILRLAETQATESPSARGVQEFARLVEEKSAGRIKIKIYDSGQVGQEANIIEQVQFGGIDFARVSLSSLGHYSSSIRMLTLPYIIRNSGQMWRVVEGPIGEGITGDLLKEKFVCLAWYDGGTRVFYNTRREMLGIEDYRGLKISVQRSPAMNELYNYMGASVMPIPTHELYRALQSGLIDGVDGSIATYYGYRHYEVAKHLVYDSQSRIPEIVIASRVTMLQLSKQDQEIIAQAARESSTFQRRSWIELEKNALRELHNVGVLIHYVDEQSMGKMLLTVQPLYNSYRAAELNAVIHY